MTDLRKWLTDNVLSYSLEEILEPVPMSSVRCRRKLMIEKSRRYQIQDPEPTVCRVCIETLAGLWQPAKGKGGWGTVVWKTKDPRAREEPTTRAVIRHWHAWRGKEYVWASFLRIGERSGAHLMTAGGEVTTIARPPLEREPPAMVSVLRPDRTTGFISDVTTTHPDRGTWERWAEMIQSLRLYVQAQRESNVPLPMGSAFFRCTDCGQYPRTDSKEWRSVNRQNFCASCYKRFDMRRRKDHG